MILTYSKEQFKYSILAGIKTHTIREDKTGRWIPGRSIQHWLYNPRHVKKNPHWFKDDKCFSIQTIKIKYNKGGGVNVFIDEKFFFYMTSWGSPWDSQTQKNMFKLSFNDGFTSVRQFFAWFNKDFTGKIIHWTDFKY